MSEYIVEVHGQMPDAIYERKVSEIVRCRDCARFVPKGTYRFNGGTVNKDTCDVIRGFVVQINPDGFCAWGERKEVGE